jgi:hypothetical protein
MLHPNQFQVNEAWIAFQLNDAPICTEADGAFNCLALMDAASCFILATVFVPANVKALSKIEAKRLLKGGHAHKQEMPRTLFIPNGQSADELELEAKGQKVTVIRVPEDQLLVFIAEARESFKEHLGGGRTQ